jgi:hypothetical protein
MKLKSIMALLTASVLIGCANHPEKIPHEEIVKFSNIKELIESKLKLPSKENYGIHIELNGNVIQPYVYAKDYCEANGGSLYQAKIMENLKLPPHTQMVSTSLSGGNYVQSTQSENAQKTAGVFSRSFGEFECQKEGKSTWAVGIYHSGAENIRDQYGQITVSNIYTTVVSVSYLNL